MHSLGHLMTSEGEKQFVLIVFLLGQFVITATSATRFRNSGSPVKVPEEQTGSRCSHLIHIFDHIFGNVNNRAGQKTLQRLEADKAIERTMRGHYKKLVSELPII